MKSPMIRETDVWFGDELERHMVGSYSFNCREKAWSYVEVGLRCS